MNRRRKSLPDQIDEFLARQQMTPVSWPQGCHDSFARAMSLATGKATPTTDAAQPVQARVTRGPDIVDLIVAALPDKDPQPIRNSTKDLLARLVARMPDEASAHRKPTSHKD